MTCIYVGKSARLYSVLTFVQVDKNIEPDNHMHLLQISLLSS